MLPRLISTAFGTVLATWLAAYQPEQSRQYVVVVDRTFSPAARATIQRSLAAWRRAVPALTLTARVGAACDPRIPNMHVICVVRATLVDGLAGQAQYRGNAGALVELPDGTDLQQADVVHELGHAMGIWQHSKVCGDTMFAARYEHGIRCDSPVPTQGDVKAWHRVAR